MAYTLTSHYDRVIDQLIRAGHFGNRSEVVRAGLRKLEQEYLSADYLRPPPLPPGSAARSYKRQTKAEREEERRAVRASNKPRKLKKARSKTKADASDRELAAYWDQCGPAPDVILPNDKV